MGIKGTVVDWLGRVLGTHPASTAEPSDLTREYSEDLQSCRWMEVARHVMCGYVTSALQRCPVVIYEDGRSVHGTHADWLWNVSPNPNQSRSQFMAELLERLLVDPGEALVVPVSSGGVKRLFIADAWTPNEVSGAATVYSNISIDGSTEVLPWAMSADEVYHFDMRGVGGGWKQLMDATSTQYDQIAEVILRATADRNGRKWIVNYEMPMTGTEEQRKAIEEQIQRSIVPFVKRTTGVMPLFKGQTLERASLDSGRFSGMNAKDIANIRADMFGVVAGCFRVPVSMLEGKTASYDSDLSSFLTFAVDPIARMLSEEITRKQFDRRQWANGCRAEVDTHHVRHVDLFEAADKVEKLVGSSIDSPNEIRGFTGQDPIDEPWADEYQRTKNHEDAGGGETK